jgi:nicotinate-nucleotide adenylyltransferase
MRIGFFGGSFDPPHRGHLAVARAAMTAFALDRVLLAPAALQPLKRARAEAAFADRLRMVELLCADAPGLEASAIDGPQPNSEPNYTIDTLARLRAALAADTQLFIIVGADSFLTVRQWRSAEDLLLAAEWIVVSRPGFDLHALDALDLSAAQRPRVHLLDGVAEPVSATEVRAALHARRDCTGLVPQPVLAYIHRRHLYGAA